MTPMVYVLTRNVDWGEDTVIAVYADEAHARREMTPSDSLWTVPLNVECPTCGGVGYTHDPALQMPVQPCPDCADENHP